MRKIVFVIVLLPVLLSACFGLTEDELVAKTYEPDFRSDFQEAINRAAKK